jgi:hypothetical protein
MTMPAQLTKLVTELAADLRPSIAALEAAPAATKNHYGAYLGIIGRIANRNPAYGKVAVLALIAAGANRQGVADAYRLAFGSEQS